MTEPCAVEGMELAHQVARRPRWPTTPSTSSVPPVVARAVARASGRMH